MRGRRTADPARPLSAYRLPAGLHGLAPELVAENQRWRLLGAAAEVLAERGYAGTTSAHVAHHAGVSSSTFYAHFDNLDACLLAAYEMAADCLVEVVAGACDPDLDSPRRLRNAIDEAIAFLASEPTLARLFGAEAPAGVASIAATREHLIDRLTALLSPGPASGIGLDGPSAVDVRPTAAEVASRHLISGALALISDRVAAGEAARLAGLAPELVEVVASYG